MLALRILDSPSALTPARARKPAGTLTATVFLRRGPLSR